MPHSLGRIPYLNTEPFFGDDPVRAESRTATPRAMIDLVARRSGRRGATPGGRGLRHPDRFMPVGGLGIATHADAKSVLLFSRVPPADLGGRRIGVIDDRPRRPGCWACSCAGTTPLAATNWSP